MTTEFPFGTYPSGAVVKTWTPGATSTRNAASGTTERGGRGARASAVARFRSPRLERSCGLPARDAGHPVRAPVLAPDAVVDEEESIRVVLRSSPPEPGVAARPRTRAASSSRSSCSPRRTSRGRGPPCGARPWPARIAGASVRASASSGEWPARRGTPGPAAGDDRQREGAEHRRDSSAVSRAAAIGLGRRPGEPLVEVQRHRPVPRGGEERRGELLLPLLAEQRLRHPGRLVAVPPDPELVLVAGPPHVVRRRVGAGIGADVRAAASSSGTSGFQKSRAGKLTTARSASMRTPLSGFSDLGEEGTPDLLRLRLVQTLEEHPDPERGSAGRSSPALPSAD